MYSSSFSKTIAPGLRVGYAIVPAAMTGKLEELVASTYITPALLAQATVYEFLRRGLFESNLERVCGLLKARRDSMLDALERELSGRARWNRPEGGYFLWLELPDEIDASELLARASEAGVTFVPGAAFVRAAGLQLRLAGRDRRGRAAARRASGAGGGAGIAARPARRRANRAPRSTGSARSARRARCRAQSGRGRACCSRARTRSRIRSAGRG